MVINQVSKSWEPILQVPMNTAKTGPLVFTIGLQTPGRRGYVQDVMKEDEDMCGDMCDAMSKGSFTSLNNVI